jgi:hypothetical protein
VFFFLARGKRQNAKEKGVFACFNQPHSTGDVQQKKLSSCIFFCYKKKTGRGLFLKNVLRGYTGEEFSTSLLWRVKYVFWLYEKFIRRFFFPCYVRFWCWSFFFLLRRTLY